MARDLDFELAIDRFADLGDEEFLKLTRAVNLQALRGLVLRTPVDTGRARGNWQTTVRQPAAGEVERADKGGGEAVADGANLVSRLELFEDTWLTNNVPYILALEDGSSQQAPSGMLAATMESLEAQFA